LREKSGGGVEAHAIGQIPAAGAPTGRDAHAEL
jgi:hypothetical protein